MKFLSKLLNPNASYIGSGDHAVHVRAGHVMAAVVTDTPLDVVGSTPIRDMQEICVVISHHGYTSDKSARRCAIQIVRRTKGGGDLENLYELILDLGSDDQPHRQAAKYPTDQLDKNEKAVDWTVDIPSGALINKLGW